MESKVITLCVTVTVGVKGFTNLMLKFMQQVLCHVQGIYEDAPFMPFCITRYHCPTFTDVWSAGCVLAELLLGQPIFPGASGVDQLVEIIKVLGTPTREQIKEMNPHYTEFKFPQIKPHPWSKVDDSLWLLYMR